MTKNLLLGLFLCLAVSAKAQIITSIAGTDSTGYNGDNIPALTAELNQPIGVAVDAAGNVYIADRYNNRVRKVSTAGIITTIAGVDSAGYSGDGGPATNATLNYPYGVAVDDAGNVYIADTYNERIRKVDNTGVITTIAGNGTRSYNGDNIPATAAELHTPGSVAVDGSGNIYIADCFNYRIRKVNTDGFITTVGGDSAIIDSGDNGPATTAGIDQPYAIALDAAGNIYIGEQEGNHVRKINTTGIITTVAGTGIGGFSGDGGLATNAEITQIYGITVDVSGNLFITDGDNNRIRKVDPAGIITTYAGTGAAGFGGDGGPALSALLGNPAGLAVSEAGDLYIADAADGHVRHITSVLGVNNLYANSIALYIYPNPSEGAFTINLSQSIDEQANVTVTNIAGEEIKQFEINTNTPVNVNLNARAGVYLITIVTQSGIYTNKLVIEE